MARKKKKNKKSNSNITLSHVLEVFNGKDYAKADQLLKKAKVKYDQAGLAKQLKIELRHQQALSYFKEERYQMVIDLLNANFTVQAKEGFPLAIEKTHILIGLSYAYLMNFEEASRHLVESTKHEHTKPIVFYYLLNLLFIQKTEELNLDTFSKIHQKHIRLLDENQKNYLKAAFYMRTSDWERSIKLLKLIPTESHIQHSNLNALLHICEEKKHEAPPSSVKSLYKVLLDLEFSPNNKNYLKQFEIFNQKIGETEQDDKNEKLKEQLHQLCIVGRALPEVSFKNFINASSEEDIPYLVYNQIACLATQLDSISIQKIQKILKSHKEHFFAIPESILLYLKIINKRRRKDRFGALIFNNFEIYFKNFYKTLPPDQLNYIGWQIFFYLKTHDLDINVGILNELNKFSKAYPNIIALKWIIVLVATTNHLKDTQHITDLLSLENLAYNENGILKDFSYFLKLMDDQEYDLFGVMNKRDIKNINARLKKTIQTFHAIFNHPNIKTNNQIGLKLIQQIKNFIFGLLLEGEKIDLKPIDQLKTDYLHLITVFGGPEKNPDFYSDYQSINDFPDLANILKALYGSTRNIENLIKEGKDKLLMDVLIKQINIEHFLDEEADSCLKLLKAYVNIYKENSVEKIDHFLGRFIQECTDEGCGCDKSFLYYLLKMAAKEKMAKYSIISLTLSQIVDIKMIIPQFHFQKLTPVKYNTAADILSNISKAKVLYRSVPDEEFTKELMNYLKFVISKKTLKGLTKKYNEAKEILNY